MIALATRREATDQVFVLPDGGDWFQELRLLEIDGDSGERRSGPGESLLVVLDGTFDLRAGSGSWARRGLRGSPTAGGRPVALFLPPHTPFQASAGSGRLLLVSARQPELPPPPAGAPNAAAGRKPLLQMAGSGKAFDPVTQTWKPSEAFLESPEALLPRRFERIDAGGVPVERIAGVDYKALALRVDEAVLDAGARLQAPDPGQPAAAETLVFCWPEATARLGERTVDAPAAGLCRGTPPPIVATGGACYVLLAYAGSKLPSTT